MDEGYIEAKIGFKGFPYILSKKFLRIYGKKKFRIRIIKDFRKSKIVRKLLKKSFDEIIQEYNYLDSRLKKLMKETIVTSESFRGLALKLDIYHNYIQRMKNEKY